MFVTTITCEKKLPSVAPVDAPLKPNQPSQRASTPIPKIGMLWPGIARGLPSLPYLPRRGPSTIAAASAAVAPVRWTIVEPAKSSAPAPMVLNRPLPLQPACATSG